MNLSLKRCKGAHCKSDDTIDAKIGRTRVFFLYTSHDFDPEGYGDQTNPLDFGIEDSLPEAKKPKSLYYLVQERHLESEE